MLETIAAGILSKYLGEYIRGLEKEHLQLNVIGGDVVLERLELKTEALANLELPLEVKRGFLGKLALTIPWKSLGSTPAIAKVHELFVVIGPKSSSSTTEEDLAARETRLQHTKLRRLQLLELLRNKDDLEADEEAEGSDVAKKKKKQSNESEGDGFVKRLITKVVDNLQIFIDKVHIRYEDEVLDLAFGVTLEDLRAHSTDASFQPAFLSGSQADSHLVHKLVSLSNFAVYWNPPGSVSHGFSSACKSQDELERFLDGLIHKTTMETNDSTGHEFVLQPVSGELRVVLNKRDLPDPETMGPKLRLDFIFKRVGLALAESQFRGFLRLFDHLDTYHRRFRFLHLRPSYNLISRDSSPSTRARAYWNYAIEATKIEVREKREAWDWERIKRFRRDRIAYVALYQKKIAIERGHVSENKQSKDKMAQILQQLAEYEKIYDFDHLKIFRDLAFVAAKQYLKRRRQKRLKELEAKKEQPQPQAAPSFWGRWFGSSVSATASPTPATIESYDEDLDQQLANPQTWKELFAAVEYDEESEKGKPGKVAVPKEWVKTRISFSLEEGAIGLRELEGKITSKIAEAAFERFTVDVSSRDGGSTTISTKLGEFNIADHYTLSGSEAVELLGRAPLSNSKDRLLEVNVHTKPLDGHANLVVEVIGDQPMQIIFSRKLIDRIVEFFEDKDKSQLIASLQNAAADSYEDLKKQAQSHLIVALERKKTLDLRVNVQAPTILLPEDFTDINSSLLVVDLGQISFTSDLAKFTKEPPRGPDGEIPLEYSYDKFKLGLARLGAAITKRSGYSRKESAIAQRKRLMSDPETSLIDDFDLEFGLEICTVQSPILPKVKLLGSLPSLVAYISAGKIGDVLNLIKKIAKSDKPSKPKQAQPLPAPEAPTRPESAPTLPSQPKILAELHKDRLRKRDSLANSTNFLQDVIINTAREKALAMTQGIELANPPAIEIEVRLGHITAVLQHQGRNILDVGVHDVNVLFTKWEHHMTVKAGLGQLLVKDLIQNFGPRYQYLIASHEVTAEGAAPENGEELIQITYTGIPPESPKYRDLEHDVQIALNTLYVGANIEAIATVLAFVDGLTAALDAASEEDKSSVPQPIAQDPLSGSRLSLLSSSTPTLPSTGSNQVTSVRGVPQLLKLQVQLSSVALSLNKSGRWIATSSISNILVHVNIALDKALLVYGSLGSIQVASTFEAWPNIISTLGDKMITFSFKKYSPEEPTEANPETLSLDLRMGAVRAVYLAAFVNDIIDYFSELEAMKDYLSSTASSLKSEAIKKAEEVKKSTKVLSLIIMAEQPSVIIPDNTTSANAVLGTLGRLDLSNQIVKKEQDGKSLRFDALSIKISEIYLESIIGNQRSAVLDKTSVALTIERPLNAEPSDLIAVPKLSLTITTTPIQVYFSPPQMHLFLRILGDNLVYASLDDDDGKNTKSADTANDLSSSVTTLDLPAKPIFDLQLLLNVDKIGLFISAGEVIETVTPLIAFAIVNLDTDLRMYSNQTMNIYFAIRSVILTDSRTGSSNRFPRLIEPTDPNIDSIKISYAKVLGSSLSSSNSEFPSNEEAPVVLDQEISIGINSPRITVVTEIVCDLKDFALEQVERLLAGLDENTRKKEVLLAQIRREKTTTDQQPAEVPPVIPSPSKKGTMKLDISVNDPILCIVDNAADFAAEALLTHATFKVDFVQQPTGEEFSVQLRKFELSKCRMATTETTTVSIVDSFDVTLGVVQNDAFQKVMLTTTKLSTVVSYQDVRLGMRIADRWINRLKAKPATSHQLEIAAAAAEKVAKKAEGFTKALTASDSPAGASSAVVPKKIQHLSLNIQSFRFALIDDCNTNDQFVSNIQLLKGTLSNIEAEFKSWALAPSGYLHIQVKLQYFNSKLEALEPVIEPWKAQVQFNSELLEEEEAQNAVESSSKEAQEKKKPLHLTVVSPDALNLNVTKALLETTFKTIETWKADYENEQKQSHHRVYYPFYIRNETGRNVTYWINAVQRSVIEAHSDSQGPKVDPTVGKMIASGEEQAIDVFELNTQRSRKFNTSHTVSIEVEGLPFILQDLPFSKVGTHYISINEGTSAKQIIVFDVAYRLGSKVATLRSNVTIQNHTAFPLDLSGEINELGLSSSSSSSAASIETFLGLKASSAQLSAASRASSRPRRQIELPTLPPEGKYCVPLDLAWSGSLRARPHDSGFSWSDDKLLCVTTNDEPFPIRCAARVKSGTPWLYIVKPQLKRDNTSRELSEIQEISFVFHPPMRIENRIVCDLSFSIKEGGGEASSSMTPLPRGDNIDVYEISRENENQRYLSMSLGDFKTAEPVALRGVLGNTNSITLVNRKGSPIELALENIDTTNGTKVLTIYSQYWFINKTGLPLRFKDSSNRAIASIMPSGHASDALLRLKDPRQWYVDDADRAFPIMFSGRKVAFRIASSKWSKYLKLGNASSIGVLQVEEETEEKRDKIGFAVAVSSKGAPNKYRRTKIITFFPNFVLVNTTPNALVCAQVGSKLEYTLEPGEQVPFHWPNADGKKLIRVKFRDDTAFSWSSEFPIDQLQHFEAKMIDTVRNGTIYRLGVKIRLEEATTVVVLAPESQEFPDYLIDNQSSYSLTVRQQGYAKASPISVGPGAKVPFVWDEIQNTKKRVSVSVEGSGEAPKEYNFDKLKIWPSIFANSRHEITVEVLAEGPTKVLRLVDKRFSSGAMPRLVASTETTLASSSSASSVPPLEQVEEPRVVQFSFQMALTGIGLSIVDETPQEIIYVWLDGITVHYEESQQDQTFELKLNTLQIDNQLYLTPYPISVFAIPAEGHAFLHFSLVRSKKYSSIDYFNYLAIQMQELDIRLEENVLLKLLDFTELVLDFLRRQKGDTEEMAIFHPEKKQVYLIDTSQSLTEKMLYFELLHINPIKAKISFLSTNIANKDPSEMSTLEVVLRRGGLLANIDAAPLLLNALVLKNPFCSKNELVQRIVLHYIYQSVKQFYKILGSADFIGSPVSLVNNLGTGVYDFFYEPAQALVTSPKDFTSAVAKGSKSLVWKTVFGLFNSLTKIGESMTNAAVQASMNKEWQQERAKAALDKPQHLGEGLATGFMNFTTGLAEGVTGIVTEPIRGAQEAGVGGFAKGIGLGVIGAVLRPTVGVVDLITRTTEGIRNTAAYLDESKRLRVRWPRYFALPPILQIYDKEKSAGRTILKTIDEGRYGRQQYRFHIRVTQEQWVMMSHAQLFLLTGPSIHQLKLTRAIITSGIEDVSIPKSEGGRTVRITFTDPTKEPIVLEIADDKRRELVLQLILMELRETRNTKLSFVVPKNSQGGITLLPPPTTTGVAASIVPTSSSSSEQGQTEVTRARTVEPRPQEREPTLSEDDARRLRSPGGKRERDRYHEPEPEHEHERDRERERLLEQRPRVIEREPRGSNEKTPLLRSREREAHAVAQQDECCGCCVIS